MALQKWPFYETDSSPLATDRLKNHKKKGHVLDLMQCLYFINKFTLIRHINKFPSHGFKELEVL